MSSCCYEKAQGKAAWKVSFSKNTSIDVGNENSFDNSFMLPVMTGNLWHHDCRWRSIVESKLFSDLLSFIRMHEEAFFTHQSWCNHEFIIQNDVEAGVIEECLESISWMRFNLELLMEQLFLSQLHRAIKKRFLEHSRACYSRRFAMVLSCFFCWRL